MIRRRFTKTFATRFPDGRAAITHVTATINDEGEPILEQIRYKAPRDGRTSDRHARIDPHALLQWAFEAEVSWALLQKRAQTEGVHLPGMSYLDLEDDEIGEVFAQAARLARPRGPYKLTEDFLRDVVDASKKDDIETVAKKRDKSVRTVRRWIQEARERGIS